MNTLDIVAPCGGLRRGPCNRMALQFAAECLPPSRRIEVLDGREVPMFDGDEFAQGLPPVVAALRERIRRAGTRGTHARPHRRTLRVPRPRRMARAAGPAVVHHPEARTMKLYYHPLSTYSQKVLIAFDEKGVACERQVVDLFDPTAKAAFEKLTPIGKVPFLKPSDDWDVPESTSIIEYLEDKFPGTPRLIPAGGGDAARQVRFMDRMADLYLNEPVTELLFQKVGFRPKDEAKAERARKHATMSYAALDKMLATRTWMAGDAFSMADCAAIPPLYYAQTGFPFDAYPNVAAYVQRALQRPSYAKVRAEFEPIWFGMLKKA